MNNSKQPPIDPKLLKPCPECNIDLVYIPGGDVSKFTGKPYEGYYRCYNQCKTLEGNHLYPVKFSASKYKYHLKDKS